MRAFIGIPLPEEIRGSLARLQQELAASEADVNPALSEKGGVKWVAPESLHVTLKFLDEISEVERQAVEQLLARIAQQEPSFQLGLKGVGAFPSPQAPRVVWVGIEEGKDRVTRIAEAIEREGAAIPLRKDERPFSAHLTIGRLRSPRRREALVHHLASVRWNAPLPWMVTSVTCYQSVLSASGPTYTVLAEIPLAR